MLTTANCRFAVLFCVTAALVQMGVAQTLPRPQEGILLLKHGTTLSGFITPSGDRYVVLLGDSGEARVPAKDVAAVFGSLREVYEFKRSKLDDSLAARIALARWCIQQEMPALAADQVLAAESLFGRQPQLESLHQRLLAIARRDAPSAKSTGTDTTIAQVDFEEESGSFPRNAIESFTSTVQPLLLNRCASGGCHSMRGTSEYVLFRPFLGQATTRRLTERNLKATLAYVDRTSPLESILLEKAATAHGDAASAPIVEREQKQLDALAGWVRSFGARQRSSTPTTIAPTNELLYQSGRGSNTDSSTATTTSQAAQPPKKIAEPIGDPFDPARFNQRHHGRTQ